MFLLQVKKEYSKNQMFTNISTNEVCFFMPEDGIIAQENLLKELSNIDLAAVYIKAYAFNWDDFLNKVKELDSKQIPVYILADYVQARGPGAWDKLVDLHKSLKYGSLILTTAGINSISTGQIWHSKAVSLVYRNRAPKNWAGSVNFSASGWTQGNTSRLFESQTWSDEFIKHFKIHQSWALTNQPQKQIDYILSHPIQVQDYEETEENSDLIFELKNTKYELKSFQYATIVLAVIGFIELFIIVAPKIW